MVFSSLEFLLLFLPAVLVGYYAIRSELRNAWLLVASIAFYAYGEPKFVLVMMASILFNYLAALAVSACRRPALRKSALAVAILANVALIFVYKYANFATSVVRSLFPDWQGVIPQTSFLLPIGISFFTFQAISYVVDVYRGAAAQRNPVNIALYIAMFPQLIAGPIVRYETVAEQLVSRRETLGKFSGGVGRFLVGFAKKTLLANLFAATADKYFAAEGMSVCGAWLGAVAYTFQIYFDFSGYSDMAIGLGLMFGFEFLENFNYPYISRSVTEFWRRWHMSLGSWFRDYVYFPLGGSRVSSSARLVFNLSVVWLATGVWHGANWTFILWGSLYGVLIIAEKLTNWPKCVEGSRVLGIVGWVATMFFVILGWVLFRATSLTAAGSFLATMFGFGAEGFLDDATYFEFGETAVLLMTGAAASVPWVPWLRTKLEAHPLVLGALEVGGRIGLLALFFVGVSYLAMNAHNPFIYFNF